MFNIEKIPKAINTFRDLSRLSPSSELQQYLNNFKKPKELNEEIFLEGVKEFIPIANYNSLERTKFFGNKYFGLHSNNDLAKIWNADSAETIQSLQLISLAPHPWRHLFKDGHRILVYTSNAPSYALDKLLQGPTVIDCGMFTQLCIWFGIRYILGDDQFNALFGLAPFYLTQIVYEPITDPLKPYTGNPLYCFFNNQLSSKESALIVVNFPNDPFYTLKHAGGNDGTENCLLIDGGYTIFDPTLQKTSGLTEQEIEELLRETFNADQDEIDQARLAFYSKRPNEMHPLLSLSFCNLISTYQVFSNYKIDPDSWNENITIRPRTIAKFGFNKFISWLKNMQENKLSKNYVPLPDDKLTFSNTFLEQIPYESRDTMSFDTYKNETPIQEEMKHLALHFCQSVIQQRSINLTLTGIAGIGKTAAAICCAKELINRHKKVVWISEVTVRGWTEQATSLEEVEACRGNVKRLLGDEPDAVFLDDDNLIGFAGRVLLEEIYVWYVTNPGKGLFITSNETITFEECFDIKLNGEMLLPPFPGYISPMYINTIVKNHLIGESFRPTPILNLTELSDSDKLNWISNVFTKCSVAIVIDNQTFERRKHFLQDVEYIPAFDNNIISSVRNSLLTTGEFGPSYSEFSDIQKSWLKTFKAGNDYDYSPNGRLEYVPLHTGIGIIAFEKTVHEIIAVEMVADNDTNLRMIGINDDCKDQLIRAINYAHDKGGKKLIIINHTNFSNLKMIKMFKKQIGKKEAGRTISRLDSLLSAINQLSSSSQITYQEVSRMIRKQPFLEATCLTRYGLLRKGGTITPLCLTVSISPQILTKIVSGDVINEKVMSLLKTVLPIAAADVFLDRGRYNLLRVLRADGNHVIPTSISTLNIWLVAVPSYPPRYKTTLGLNGMAGDHTLGIAATIGPLTLLWAKKTRSKVIKKIEGVNSYSDFNIASHVSNIWCRFLGSSKHVTQKSLLLLENTNHYNSTHSY